MPLELRGTGAEERHHERHYPGRVRRVCARARLVDEAGQTTGFGFFVGFLAATILPPLLMLMVLMVAQ